MGGGVGSEKGDEGEGGLRKSSRGGRGKFDCGWRRRELVPCGRKLRSYFGRELSGPTPSPERNNPSTMGETDEEEKDQRAGSSWSCSKRKTKPVMRLLQFL